MVSFMMTLALVSMLGAAGYVNKEELKNISSVEEAIQWVRDIEPVQDYDYPGEENEGE